MTEPPLGIEPYLDHCFEKFVAPLLGDLRLQVEEKQVSGMGALYQLMGAVIKVRLVNDRGFIDLSVAPRHLPNDYWDLQLIDALFEEPPRRGVRLLNLEEQVARLRSSWPQLNEMFSPAKFEFTRRRLVALGEERARRLFGHDVA